MRRRTCARRAVLHLAWICFCKGTELLKIVTGRPWGDRHQYDRLLDDERDRGKVRSGIVLWLSMKRLIGRVRAAGAEHELITVGRGLGDAIGAGHAARTADVFDNDLLSQEL